MEEKEALTLATAERSRPRRTLEAKVGFLQGAMEMFPNQLWRWLHDSEHTRPNYVLNGGTGWRVESISIKLLLLLLLSRFSRVRLCTTP